jgi:hypothetical protein
MNARSKWLLAGALALGVGAAIPSPTFAQNRDRNAARDEETTRQVKYNQLPADVKATVDKERKNHEVKRIDQVRGANVQDFYRVIIDEKGTDRVIRVAPNGRLLTEQDLRDTGPRDARNGVERGDRAADRGGDENGVRQVKYAQLPGAVKETLDKQRGQRDVKRIDQVQRAGSQDFFRAIIDTRGSDKVVRIAPDGRLLSAQAVKDEGVRREIRLGRGESDAEEVDFNRLPGPVKTEIGRLAKSDDVQEVIRFKRNGQTVYRAEVGEGRYTRFIRVDENGRNLGVRGDVDEGDIVKFDRTPGAVKSKIGALAKSGDVQEVIKYERGGRTYYQAEVEDQNGKRYFHTVDENGREADLPRVEAR